MTLYPLRRAGMAWGTALGLAFASDTLSMTTMELVDNAIMVMVPGAMDAGLPDPLFWGSLVLSLLLAGVAAFPVNRWLIARGKGHALVHGQHCPGHVQSRLRTAALRPADAEPEPDRTDQVGDRTTPSGPSRAASTGQGASPPSRRPVAHLRLAQVAGRGTCGTM